jgi:hypothetical protein
VKRGPSLGKAPRYYMPLPQPQCDPRWPAITPSVRQLPFSATAPRTGWGGGTTTGQVRVKVADPEHPMPFHHQAGRVLAGA